MFLNSFYLHMFGFINSVVVSMSIEKHRRQSWGFGVETPRFWDGGLWGLHEILLYTTMYRNMIMTTLSKVVTSQKIECIIYKSSADDILNPVLRASVC